MTLKIEVQVPQDMVLNDRAGSYLDRALSAIGYRREATSYPYSDKTAGTVTLTENASPEWKSHINELPDAPVREDEYAPPSVLNEPSVQQAVAKRERGKPSPGKARRTKEEIAEDDAAIAEEAYEAARQELRDLNDQDNEERNEAVKIETAMTAAEAEEVTNPVVSGPVDSPEVEAQDAADEKAEAEATQQGLTHDDLRQVMGEYVKAYGLAIAQADGPVIFLDALGAPPSGEANWKLSLVPEQKLSTAIAAWKSAIESNPFDRAKVA